MLIKSENYVINAEDLQNFIIDDLWSMHQANHQLLSEMPACEYEFYYREYHKSRALLIRMLLLQGVRGDELDMVLGYLKDLEDVICNGEYKVR
ncbi:hypothetical protein [Megasphaera sp.]|uniref:hypothetical protein n=1 Tax=Megasphaera sp. TaxID=2023260 RepID=UPI00351FE46B